MGMREDITFRKSWVAMVIWLVLLLPLVFLVSYSLATGEFIVPAMFFLALLISLAVIIVYSSVASLSLDSAGISQRTLFKRWRFRWEEIESWTIQRHTNDRSDLVFSIGLPHGVQINRAAVNSKEMREVKDWFWEYVGKPLEHDEFVRQTRKIEIE
jgi:hypothetical protein